MKTNFPPPAAPGRCATCGPRFGGQIETIKARFEAFLVENSHKPICTLSGAAPALRTLANEYEVLTRRLGDKFLGVALGGSLIHGLGTVRTSDVDYFIYTKRLDPATAESVKHESWFRLRQAGLSPCDGDPVRDLDQRPILELTSALSVFTSLIIDPPDRGSPLRGALEATALAMIRDALGEGILEKGELLDWLKEEHRRLIGCDAAYVAAKFMANRAPEFIQEGAAIVLAHDEDFLREMTEIAAPYMQGRARYCPFPERVAELFREGR